MNEDTNLNFVSRGRSLVWFVGISVLLSVLCLVLLVSAESPPVSVEKEAEPDGISINSSVRYTATFSNSSDADVALLVLSDTLPADFTFTSIGFGSDIVDYPVGTTGTIIWTGPYTVPAHSTLHLIYNVWVEAPARPTPFENHLEALLSTGESISDSASVQVIGVDLTGSKQASPSLVYRGEPVDYTVVFTNNGSLDAILPAMADTLPLRI